MLLNVDCIKSSFDTNRSAHRYWINIQETKDILDPRSSKPSIKTSSSIRQLPVSEITANLIQTYIENYRGKPNHPFLLNSQWNTPLSHESITAYFRHISSSLPSSCSKLLYDRTGKKSVQPHDLRHTSAVVRLNQLLNNGDPMDEALQKLRSFFGWSRTSDMPQKYAKAVFEDRLSDVWTNIMDDRVDFLRSIPRHDL